MNRKEFIKSCGMACLGATTSGLLLQGCAGSKMVTSQLSGENLMVPLDAFEEVSNNAKSFRKYIVVHNARLQFPICLYRFAEDDFAALYMRCTHQGAELTAYGDKMVCSAHGSEFDNKGNVQNGPADKSLRSFPVSIENKQIKISLKAI